MNSISTSMANSELFEIFRQIFHVGGLWRSKPTKSFTIYGYLVHFNFVLTMFSFGIEIPYAFSQGMDKFAFNFGAVLVMIVILLKIIISRKTQYQSFIFEMFNKEEFMNSETEIYMREKYAKMRRTTTKMVKYFSFTMISTTFCTIFVSIVFILKYANTPALDDNSRKPLIVLAWTPVDSEKHYIWATITLNAISITAEMVAICADFVLVCPLVYFVFRLRMLRYVLQNNNIVTNAKNDDFGQQKYFIIQCILEHQNIIEELSVFNSMVKNMLFCDFLLHSTQIAGFVASIVNSQKLGTVQNILNSAILNYVFFQLFIVYWYGQSIIDESVAIADAIYHSNWYTADVKLRRDLIMMMMRSRKPLALSIGPLGMVNLNIFLRMIKTIYSILTIFTKK